MSARSELSDGQWQLIESLLRPKRRADRRGRPWQDTRSVLNGVLWILGTGAQRRELPKECPPYWVREGKLERILRQLAGELHIRGPAEVGRGFR
jgi:transposase